MTPEPQISDEQIDQHLNAILRASGSALRYYTATIDNLRDALRSAVLALAVPQWQPIESAPMDRTYVLLWTKTRWNKLAEYLPLTGWGAEGYWYCVNADEAVSQIKPTHWQPLPAPPAAQDKDGQQ